MSTAAALGTEAPWRWAPGSLYPSLSPPRLFGSGRAAPPPRSERSRRALGPRRAALRRYKRPRWGPTRTHGSDRSPRPGPRWTRGRTGRCAAHASPGPARDSRPGDPTADTMGAAHSASEEVRELVGKTGCEYPAGDGRGTGTGAPTGWPGGSQPAAALCDLGRVAGPLCASVSPSFKWAPAGHFAGCGEEPAAMLSKWHGRSAPVLSELAGHPRALGLRTGEGAGQAARPGRARARGCPAGARAQHLKVFGVPVRRGGKF